MLPDCRRICRLCAVWLALASAGVLPSQVLSSLTGIVRVRGEEMPNAQVTATNKETGATRTTRTDETGRYLLTNLSPGAYNLKVEVTGFRTYSRDVVVTAGQSTSTNVEMAIPPVGPLPPPPPPPQPAQPPDTATKKKGKKKGGPSRITGRDYLPQDAKEKDGYGLYSYLLFGARPTDATRARYLECLRAYLRLSSASELGRSVPDSQLNVTYLPVSARPSSPTAEMLLEEGRYDYARAQGLLAKIPNSPYAQGPYIVSLERPLTGVSAVTDPYLFQDLSSVPPEIVVLWVQEFISRSAEPEFWRKRGGPQAALDLRTAIATLAQGIDPAKKSLTEWQGLLSTLLFWKSDAKPPGR